MVKEARLYWSVAVSALNMTLGIASMVVFLASLWLPLPDVTLRIASQLATGLAVAFVFLVYVPAQVVRKLRGDFYSHDLNVRADRAHRIFGHLLRESDKLWFVKASDRLDRSKEWDRRVMQELVRLCRPERLDLYRADTGRGSMSPAPVDFDDGWLPAAREHLLRLLDDLETLPINQLRSPDAAP